MVDNPNNGQPADSQDAFIDEFQKADGNKRERMMNEVIQGRRRFEPDPPKKED